MYSNNENVHFQIYFKRKYVCSNIAQNYKYNAVETFASM